MLVEIKENPFIQIEGNFHMKLQCFREKGGFIDQKGRRSIAGLGSVTPTHPQLHPTLADHHF